MKFLRYFLAAALVFLLIYFNKVDFIRVSAFFGNSNILFIILTLASLLLSQLMQAAHYAVLLKAANISIKFSPVLTVTFVANFLNLSSAGVNGADYYKSYYLKANHNIDISANLTVLWVGRVLGIASLVFVALLLFWSVDKFSAMHLPLFGENQMLFVLLVILAVLPLVLMGLLCVPQIYRKAEPMLTALFFGKQTNDIASVLASVFRHKATLALAFVFQLFSCLLMITAITIVAYSLFGLNMALGTAGLSGIVLIAAQLPLSAGNIGFTEWMGDVLFRLSGFETGATLFITWRIASLITTVPGALLFYQQGGRRRLLEIIEIYSEECIDNENDS